MDRKLFSKNAITGIAAIFLSVSSFIAQCILEGWAMELEQWLSPLGIVSIALFIVGVTLIVWNFFRRELDFWGKKVMLEQRQEYIPQFRKVIDAMVTRMRELAVAAGKLPLEEYYDKYLKLHKTYKMAQKTLSLMSYKTKTKRLDTELR